MLIMRFVWFQRGVNAFLADVNSKLGNNQAVTMFEAVPGLLGWRWLVTVLIETRTTY